ncbi:hypothetical protein VTJ04DRAFT_376 [Mycothermus thermophilus]|uniref:uncharacterized protein n=1 Tax=Humicola insolens TaxID=85995 RepID=UPI0037426369
MASQHPTIPSLAGTDAVKNQGQVQPQDSNPKPEEPKPPSTLTPDDIPRLLASWKLTPGEHERILHEKILPVELWRFLPASPYSSSPSEPGHGSFTAASVAAAATSGVDQATYPAPEVKSTRGSRNRRPPVAILVLGQTGAGKTRLAPRLLGVLEQGPPPPPGSALPNLSRQKQQEEEGDEATALVSDVFSENKNPRPLHLIADTYKAHHPHYRTALSLLPSHASRLASDDAARWLEGVILHAATSPSGGILPCCHVYYPHLSSSSFSSYEYHINNNKPDILLEAACRSPLSTTRLITILSRGGYTIRAAVLAVAYPLSRLGVLSRYHRRLPEAGDTARGMPARRLTPKKVHDESWEGLRVLVQGLELDLEEQENGKGEEGEGGRVEKVVVVRRDGRVVYANHRSQGREYENEVAGDHDLPPKSPKRKRKWKHPPAALQVLDRERRRRLTSDERSAAEEDFAFLRALGDRKVEKEVEEIERMIAELDGEGGGGGGEGGEGIKTLDEGEFVWDGLDGIGNGDDDDD